MAEVFHLSYADYLVVALMLAVSAGIGLYFRIRGGRLKTNDDYLLAGRDMPVFPVAFSLMATFMTTTTLMGIPAEMYLFGTNMVFMNVGFLLGPAVSSVLLLPVYFENGVSTSYEYLGKRFGSSTRKISSVIFLLMNVMFNGVVVYAPALALSAVTDLSIWTSAISIGVVCTFYCTLGGMKAVLWTDVFQAFLMYACLIIVIVKGCSDLGGFTKIFQDAFDGGRIAIPTFQLDFSTRYTMYSVLLMGLAITVQCYGSSQIQIQRQLSMKTLRSATIASLISAPMLVAFQMLCCVCGLIFYAYFKDCDPMTSPQHPIQSADQLMPYYIVQSMNQYPGLPGLCIAGIFSASLSSISSAVNSMAAVTFEDIIKPLMPDTAKSVLITQGASLFYGFLSIVVSYLVSTLGNLVKASVLVVGLVAGPSLGLSLLAVLTTTANETGANIGLLSGFIIGGCLTFVPNSREYPTLPVRHLDCETAQNNNLNGTVTGNIYFENITAGSMTETFKSSLPVVHEDNLPLSYMWILPISMVTTIVVGYGTSWVVSLFTGQGKKVSPLLLCPLRRRFLTENSKGKDVELTRAVAVLDSEK